MERIYWIRKVGDRGRKESLRDGVGIEVREVVGCSWMMGSRVVGVVGGCWGGRWCRWMAWLVVGSSWGLGWLAEIVSPLTRRGGFPADGGAWVADGCELLAEKSQDFLIF